MNSLLSWSKVDAFLGEKFYYYFIQRMPEAFSLHPGESCKTFLYSSPYILETRVPSSPQPPFPSPGESTSDTPEWLLSLGGSGQGQRTGGSGQGLPRPAISCRGWGLLCTAEAGGSAAPLPAALSWLWASCMARPAVWGGSFLPGWHRPGPCSSPARSQGCCLPCFLEA